MKHILSNYFFLIVAVLVIGFFGKLASAADLKIHYHCTSDKPVVYANIEGQIAETTDLSYSPESGKSLNLVIGRLMTGHTLWIRQGYKETKRSVTVFDSTRARGGEMSLGEEGETTTTTFSFKMRESDTMITGQCDITAE